MSEYKLLLPSMGEGVMEATIVSWLVQEGDVVEEDDSMVEIATDKVDSEVPTPVSGKVIKILKHPEDVAQVGEPIAILEIEGENTGDEGNDVAAAPESIAPAAVADIPVPEKPSDFTEALLGRELEEFSGELYLSPLVKSVAKTEGITEAELRSIQGSGLGGRITKEDILAYVAQRGNTPTPSPAVQAPVAQEIPVEVPKPVTTAQSLAPVQTAKPQPKIKVGEGDEIIPMDRMRKIIAENMVRSKQISPHVTSFIETDVTNLVQWRNHHKDAFAKREGEKLTYTPIFIRAIVKAIQDFPMINISVDGDNIIRRKHINIGMATALPDGNLIVPVIKNADQLSLSGLAKAVNDLAYRARNKKLRPDDTQRATYTITNIGSFGNLMGTPIIPQPQVAIMAMGAIVKKPAVMETQYGDVIVVRSLMFMSHAYDHRVVDGSLGGMFLKRVSDYLENWDMNSEI